MDLSDQAVLRLINEGHESINQGRVTLAKALAVWTERYQDHLIRCCLFILKGDEARAREVAQETLLKVIYDKIHTYQEREDTPISAWLGMVAENLCRDEKKKDIRTRARENRYSENMTPSALSPEDIVTYRQSLSRLEHSTYEDLQIIFYKDFLQLSYKAIADKLGITEPAARQRRSRAFRRLKGIGE